MITWVLILSLLGNGTETEDITMTMQWGRQCRHNCEQFMEIGQYQGREVVNCQCMRATEYYSNMSGSAYE